MLFLGVMALNTSFSQIKIGGDSTFELVVRIDDIRPKNTSVCETISSPITLIGKVQNVLDKTSLGDEVELIFEQPWILNPYTNVGVYKLKVQFFKPIIELKVGNQIGYDKIRFKKMKFLVVSILSQMQA